MLHTTCYSNELEIFHWNWIKRDVWGRFFLKSEIMKKKQLFVINLGLFDYGIAYGQPSCDMVFSEFNTLVVRIHRIYPHQGCLIANRRWVCFVNKDIWPETIWF